MPEAGLPTDVSRTWQVTGGRSLEVDIMGEVRFSFGGLPAQEKGGGEGGIIMLFFFSFFFFLGGGLVAG